MSIASLAGHGMAVAYTTAAAAMCNSSSDTAKRKEGLTGELQNYRAWTYFGSREFETKSEFRRKKYQMIPDNTSNARIVISNFPAIG